MFNYLSFMDLKVDSLQRLVLIYLNIIFPLTEYIGQIYVNSTQ